MNRFGSFPFSRFLIFVPFIGSSTESSRSRWWIYSHLHSRGFLATSAKKERSRQQTKDSSSKLKTRAARKEIKLKQFRDAEKRKKFGRSSSEWYTKRGNKNERNVKMLHPFRKHPKHNNRLCFTSHFFCLFHVPKTTARRARMLLPFLISRPIDADSGMINIRKI